MTAYDAVIFDMDGVILGQGNGDWWPLIEQSVDQSLSEHDIREDHPAYEPLFDRMYAVFTGQVSDSEDRQTVINEIVQVCRGDGDTYQGESIADYRDLWRTHEELAADIQKQQVEDGERTFYEDVTAIEELYEHVPLGVMSNNNHAFVEYVVDHPELTAEVGMDDALATYMETCYGIGDDVEEHRKRKPEPDYIEQAAEDIGAENPLYVGDSRCDIEAAENAGMDAVFIRRSHRADYTLNGHDPLEEITSLQELPEIVEYGTK